MNEETILHDNNFRQTKKYGLWVREGRDGLTEYVDMRDGLTAYAYQNGKSVPLSKATEAVIRNIKIECSKAEGKQKTLFDPGVE